MKRSGEYSVADFRNGMPPRAFGSETEYTNDRNVERAHAEYLNKESPFIPEPPTLASFVEPAHLVSTGEDEISDAILKTGGRIYVDFDVLEYATPECRTPKELALHERAGEAIVYRTVQNMGDADPMDPVNVYKRSGYATVMNKKGKVLVHEGSVGHHENYTSLSELSLLDLEKFDEHLARNINAKYFADYLALRKLIDGVGMVDMEHFSITQRPRAVDFRNFKGTTGHLEKRPFYLADDRLEVRTGEGNKSDWTIEMKYGLTSLVLRLIEHGKFPSHLHLADPNQAVADLARDPHDLVELQNGRLRKGADVLKEMVDMAVELGQSHPDWPAYEQKAATDFYKFYDDLQLVSLPDHEVSALSDRIDWAARFEYLVGRGARFTTFTTRDLGQVRDDLKWDLLGTRDIARKHFAKFGHTAIRELIPPAPSTRAETRVKIARELFKASNLWSVHWDVVIANDGRHFELGGPLEFGYTLSNSNSEHTGKLQ